LARGEELVGAAVVDGLRDQPGQGGVVVFSIVSVEEGPAKISTVCLNPPPGVRTEAIEASLDARKACVLRSGA
jgi:hypothetical protein